MRCDITHMGPSAFAGHVPDPRRDNRGCQRLHRTTARARRGSSPLHEGNARSMTTASNDNSTLKVGFIGLGAIGEPMARHLHARGMLAVVGNRTQGKADALAAELGARAARSPDNFAGCDVVALCVSFDADVLENVEGLANLLHPGAVVIDHSTVSVDTARRAAAMLAAHNIGFLAAPVSGGVAGARHGQLAG